MGGLSIKIPRAAALLLAIAWTVLGGCNKSSIKLYPVSGKVLFKDQPAEGAQVVFHPVNGATKEQPLAYGTATSDGSFQLRTEYGEGAVPGDYNVMVTWYGANPRNPDAAVNKLPAKYADQSAPVLKAAINEQKNDLEPFRLK